ncbi:alkylglycerone-phosphate synthase [Alcanivorax hongdengensis A-11-3]|uniref:Alkylglycerone-phosphate synthase n=1 Tax=Alcanivorax hongdengensis A-11-3 TaxID=1177179 RepID=L0WE47_9GAMM|nr:FAD-binding oxidoreductase [Alcanivorax hongdengensis]EKF74080.1 alkylglycerone-phosphate synthase [Alcanivorax hongdengensis A-11-3]
MRRWNGWGDSANHYPLKPSGLRFIQARLGNGIPLSDADLQAVLQQVPASRLPDHPLVSTDAELRVRHARGQSLPDWLAMRSGDFQVFPDGVALPQSSDQVRELLDWARANDIAVIPYGGGTSVVGHINPPAQERPVLTLSLAAMNQLLDLDTQSQIATFGAGTPGPQLEAQLREKGYLLGHFPQSWELSTVGGWVASRSSGQQSMRYGRIEQMFAGGRVETPRGTLEIPTIPASSAGPDLREMVLGSEGRLGVITEVKVRVTPLPETETFQVAFAPDWDTAVALVREMTQSKLPLSMLRLSNAEETRTHLMLAGHERLVGLLHRYLRLRGCGDNKCMITFGVTGPARQSAQTLAEARRRIRQAGGVMTGTLLGKKWEEARFRSPYLRHGLWEHGYAVDTLETCVDWSRVTETMNKMEQAIRDHAGDGEAVHVFTHLSHLYPQGSSIYTTYVFRCSPDYQQTHQRWQAMKTAASDVIARQGGTISHQHGVGRDHAPWLVKEKGEQGMAALQALMNHFDPEHHLNPGCLLDDSNRGE